VTDIKPEMLFGIIEQDEPYCFAIYDDSGNSSDTTQSYERALIILREKIEARLSHKLPEVMKI